MKARARLSFLLALLLVATAALAFAGARWAEAQARAAADAAAEATARNHVGLLASELQKFRLLPLVLADNPDVADALRGAELDGDANAAQRLNPTLELLAARTSAAAIYALDRSGRTVAASNWRLPTSFVGQRYGFRPYFTEAMRSDASELFALGTVSGRPGLYLARRVSAGARVLGVIVVKVEFDAVEANWARSPGISIVVDSHGVVLVTSMPGWRFLATRPLGPATLADARRTLQFGATTPGGAPIRMHGRAASVGSQGTATDYRTAAVAAPFAGARLLHLSPLAPPLAAARNQALLWAVGALLLLGAVGAVALRAAETRRLHVRARERLEREVVRRTAELRDANDRLIVESQERSEADRRFRAAREELAQANRLGSLGQITAGVAHEINQPVAAIRTFAENAATLLDRGSPERTRENLGHIVSLTERIGAITAELRAFARRKTPLTGTTTPEAVVDGMLLLLGDRVAGRVTVHLAEGAARTPVVGDRIRLEQVLVNLVQNALDAVAMRRDPRIVIAVAAGATGSTVVVRVEDNGVGIDPSIRDTLFSPFASAKPEGLGLGLAIARDIAREFGGELALAGGDAAAEGATFLLTLTAA